MIEFSLGMYLSFRVKNVTSKLEMHNFGSRPKPGEKYFKIRKRYRIWDGDQYEKYENPLYGVYQVLV